MQEKSKSNMKPTGEQSEAKSNRRQVDMKNSNLQSSINDAQVLQQSQTDQSTLNNTFVNNFTFTFKINDTFGNKS